jgi:hypothetical protein
MLDDAEVLLEWSNENNMIKYNLSTPCGQTQEHGSPSELTPTQGAESESSEKDSFVTVPDILLSLDEISLLSTSNEQSIDSSPESTDLVSISLPSPELNSIQLPECKIFSAILQNALALGIDLDFLMASCTSPTQCYMSPWYRRDITPQHDLSLLISEAPLGIPDNLRPTIAQILIPHHVSLDLIPLPQFRDRAIMLGAALPHFFNLHELKTDIYGRGALFLSKNATHSWDWRCWEAQPWFLRKWSMAVDNGSRELKV